MNRGPRPEGGPIHDPLQRLYRVPRTSTSPRRTIGRRAKGFSEGQFVLHLASALSRARTFRRIVFTPRADAGTGTPPATRIQHRSRAPHHRFDQSDPEVSFGRTNTPINWGTTAYHHGNGCRRRSAARMTQFGGRFIPVHFVGALVEGTAPTHGWHIG
jgi:hypothetical protein